MLYSGLTDPANSSVSIVIVNWNTGDVLAGCLTSVIAEGEAQSGALSLEIIVVDNGSTDGSAERVQHDFPAVTVIANSQNAGYAAANNQGLRLAQGRYLLLLNPDTVLRPGALAVMVAFMDAHPAAGIVGPRLVYPDGSLQPSGRPAPRLSSAIAVACGLPRLLRQDPFLVKGRDYTRVGVVDEVSGACLMIRREAMDKAGLLDEGYFMYFEDIDWCLRVRQQGWLVYYLPAAEVVHYMARSSRQRPAIEQAAAYTQSQVRFFRRYHGKAQAVILRSVLATAAAVKAVAFAIALPFSSSRKPDVRRRLDVQQRIISICRHPGEM